MIFVLQAAVLVSLITLKILCELPTTTTIPAMERHNYKECNIFMIQINNMEKINIMQACSMESVAVQHQNLTVCLAVYVSPGFGKIDLTMLILIMPNST